MPPTYRRRVPQPPLSPPEADPYSDSDEEYVDQDAGEAEEIEDLEEGLEQDEDDEEVEEDAVASPIPSPTSLANSAPPPNFREISTLASWTVSSSKPGCSIPQLRHPSTQLFWQSDGPQPHYLNIHFFKLVRVVGLRLFLDFEADESYTPTRILLLAGSGMNDLVEWGEMRLENPRGWIWADFEGVRDPETDSDSDTGSGSDSDDSDAMDQDDANERRGARAPTTRQGRNAAPLLLPPPETTPRGGGGDDPTSDFENATPSFTTPIPTQTQPNPSTFTTPTPGGPNPLATDTPTLPVSLARPTPRHPFTPLDPSTTTTTTTPASARRRRARKPPKPPVLRCHLIQIKILENHQNGKDTHLRGLQVFALDNERDPLAAAAKEAAAYRREGRSGGAGSVRVPRAVMGAGDGDDGGVEFAGLGGARRGRGMMVGRNDGGGSGGGGEWMMMGEEPVLR
ncbi:galactose-binding like protein [Periconia macrospinosa]|uniref:Galactose-binding like protein n=1 Tax=Periconia macrospinosa TaxID=97972 RepID=A0A2V1DF68_9PLEO|nr:galactose-binding like protein [Periconia macrospinosa]